MASPSLRTKAPGYGTHNNVCFLRVFVVAVAAIAAKHSTAALNSLHLTFTTPQWVSVDVPLAAQLSNYSNPFLDVAVQATFTCTACTNATGEWPTAMTRSAFWNGSDSWVVRFAPPMLGVWQFTVACTSAACTGDAGLNGISGTVTAVPYVGDNPLYAHGFVRIPRESGTLGRYMQHSDGTPFFWLGDTHWMGPDLEHLDDCNAPVSNCSSIFRYIVDDRVAKGFSVYQTYFHGDTDMWWTRAAPTWDLLSPSNFSLRLDVMLQYVISRGMMPALGMGLHYMSEEMPPSSLATLGAYVSARYGAWPVVWITAQEVNAPNSNASVWHAAASALAADDAQSYAHPLSAHMWVFANASTNAEPTVWATDAWHTYFATQGGHTGMGIRPQSHYQFYYDFDSPAQPFLEAEAMYENIICGPRYAFANDTRRAAYKSLLCGALGYTYGAAAIWLFKYNLNDTTGNDYNPNTWWYPGLTLPGSTHMSYLAALLRGLPWWRLTPRFGDANWCAFAAPEETVLASVGNELYVVYAYDGSSASNSSSLGLLRGMDTGAAYAGAWFDPRTGAWSAMTTVAPNATGDWPLPPKPTFDDWVAVVNITTPSRRGDAAAQ